MPFKIVISLTAVLWVVLTSVFIQSCKSDTDSFSSDLAAQQKAASLSLSWEKGLSRCIRFSGPILQKYGLSLIDYQLSDVVGSDEINKGIASDTRIPVYDNTEDWNDFTIRLFGDVDVNTRQKYLERKILDIEQNELSDLAVVKLTWNYNGECFETQCYVSDTEVIYDPVFSNFHFISFSEGPQLLAPCLTQIKTKSEPVTGKPGPVSTIFEKKVVDQKANGDIRAQAAVSVIVYGMRDSTGVVSITSYETAAPYSATAGNSAKAEVKVTSFEKGQNGHLQFDFALATSRGNDISFDFKYGVGFSISQGASGETGSKYIDASELK